MRGVEKWKLKVLAIAIGLAACLVVGTGHLDTENIVEVAKGVLANSIYEIAKYVVRRLIFRI